MPNDLMRSFISKWYSFYRKARDAEDVIAGCRKEMDNLEGEIYAYRPELPFCLVFDDDVVVFSLGDNGSYNHLNIEVVKTLKED